MIARHLQHPPRAPSLRTENHIPRTLEELVLACLAKERDQRPSSAAEVARRLAAVDVMAWGDEEASRWWDTHHGATA